MSETENLLKMDSSKEAFIRLLEHVINELKVHKVFSSESTPFKRNGPVSVTNEHRFDIVISGVKHMTFAAGGTIKDIMMEPGDVHYAPPNNWKWPVWDSFHEMSSILFGPDYIRLTYINYNKYTEYFKTHGALIYYITSNGVDQAGQKILSAMQLIAQTGKDSELNNLFMIMLRLTLDCLIKDEPCINNRSRETWHKLVNYLNNNFYYPINRAHVAAEFGLSPSYISRLFKREGNTGFNETLRNLRMEYAIRLLSDSDMNIKEITEQCGYLSDTFFIAAFKNHYGVSPGQFRKQSLQSRKVYAL